MKILVFGTKSYDRESFEKELADYPDLKVDFTETNLTPLTATLAQGYEAVCAFVNADVSAMTLEVLRGLGVGLVLMRCAGFDAVNVDFAKQVGMRVTRVPAYSPEAIAERAARLTPQDAAVFLDTSTTVLCLASLLALRSDLTVITNSIDVCQALARSGSKILVTGGLYHTKSNSCVGSWALRSMESVNVDVAFLGCDGFSPEGPTIRSYQEVEFKRMVARRAKRTVLLADTSKLGNTGLYTFANYADFSLMIFERELNVGERKVLPKNVALIDVVPPS